MKSHVLRQAVERDIEKGFTHYLEQANPELATAFIEAVEAALDHITRFPSTGSPRYGELLDTPGLRSWLLTRFPFIMLYVERDDHLDVLRLLHQHADIPAHLQSDH